MVTYEEHSYGLAKLSPLSISPFFFSFVALDCETTGFVPETDRIIEVGMRDSPAPMVNHSMNSQIRV
jgi:hypothetical protein